MPLRVRDLPAALATRLGLTVPKRQKFNAQPRVVDGMRFASQREADRYGDLRYREKAGEIENLQCQPQYLITKDGLVMAVMTLDFRYTLRGTRTWVHEDVKGGNATRTEAYRLRKVLVEQQYGIAIQEV